MNLSRRQKPLPSQSTEIDSVSGRHCAACAFVNICAASEAGQRQTQAPAGSEPVKLEPVVQELRARRTLRYSSEQSELVPIICQGWATLSIALNRGRRQILSFLLPGEFADRANLLGRVSMKRHVAAITDTTIRSFKRSELHVQFLKRIDLLDRLIKCWIEEDERRDQLVIDLGQRSAEERVARLILSLAERLAKRGMMQGPTMEFPLRQHQIADAVGLTPVYVGKVLNAFQQDGLIKINRRSLTIRNAALLHVRAEFNDAHG